MSALDSVYNSRSGLMGFSTALNNLSGNVANMNTPGYKSLDTLFGDIADTSGDTSGVRVDKTQIEFAQGQFSNMGSNTDVAINGGGFFVVKNGGENLYTRSGQFTFDQSGYLVSSQTGYRVQALGSDNTLSDIKMNMAGSSPPEPTTDIKFSGSLYPSTSTGSTVPDSGGITLDLYDADGNLETVTITFTKLDSSSLPFSPTPGDSSYWQVAVTPSSGSSGIVSSPLQTSDVAQDGNIIAFKASGAISDTYNQLTLDYQFGDSAAEQRQITLNFGGAGTFSGINADPNNAQSGVTVSSNNGRAIGYTSESKVTIDTSGNIHAEFTNGDAVTLGRLALAQFVTNADLIRYGANMFRANGQEMPNFGYASSGSFGQVMSGQLENSNVDITNEFSEIIILQRGYQASSQILTSTDKMLQQLYDSVKDG